MAWETFDESMGVLGQLAHNAVASGDINVLHVLSDAVEEDGSDKARALWLQTLNIFYGHGERIAQRENDHRQERESMALRDSGRLLNPPVSDLVASMDKIFGQMALAAYYLDRVEVPLPSIITVEVHEPRDWVWPWHLRSLHGGEPDGPKDIFAASLKRREGFSTTGYIMYTAVLMHSYGQGPYIDLIQDNARVGHGTLRVQYTFKKSKIDIPGQRARFVEWFPDFEVVARGSLWVITRAMAFDAV